MDVVVLCVVLDVDGAKAVTSAWLIVTPARIIERIDVFIIVVLLYEYGVLVLYLIVMKYGS